MASLIRSIEQEVERRRREEEAERRSRRRSRAVVRPAVVVVALLNLYLLVAPPAWLIPPSAPPPSTAQEEIALRLHVYLYAQRVESYLRENGTLPAETAEESAGGVEVRYRPNGRESFEILGRAGTAQVVYSSLQPAADFLGEYRAALAGSAR